MGGFLLDARGLFVGTVGCFWMPEASSWWRKLTSKLLIKRRMPKFVQGRSFSIR